MSKFTEARRAELVGALYAALDSLLRTGLDEGPAFDKVIELIRARDFDKRIEEFQTIDKE
jgi:hypothetical protein